MSQIKKKFIADKAIDASKILLNVGESIKFDHDGVETPLFTPAPTSIFFNSKPVSLYNPVSAGDLTNKSYVDGEVSSEADRAAAAEALLSGRLDSLEADSTTKSYVDGLDAATNARIDDIISNVDPSALDSLSEIVSAFQAADGDLQAAITAALGTHTSELAEEVARATAEEARIEGKVDSEISDRQSEITRVEGLISDEEARAMAAESALSDSVSAEEARAMAAESALSSSISDEETRAMGEESRIEGLVSQEVLDRQAAVSAEQSRAEGEESRIEGLVTQEVSDRQAAVSAEQSRAQGEEARIEAKLDQEILDRAAGDSAEQARAEAAEASLQSNIDAEEARAMGEESRIEGKVDQEVLDRAAAVSAEESARIAGDSNLQGQLDTEKGRIDAILLASEADKDSFAEIVSLINSVDTENDQAFASYVLSNDAALAQEVSDRQSGDSQLQSNLDAEEAARIAGDSAEQARAEAAESALSDAIAAEQAAREAEDATLLKADGSRTMMGSLNFKWGGVGNLVTVGPITLTAGSNVGTISTNIVSPLRDYFAQNPNDTLNVLSGVAGDYAYPIISEYFGTTSVSLVGVDVDSRSLVFNTPATVSGTIRITVAMAPYSANLRTGLTVTDTTGRNFFQFTSGFPGFNSIRSSSDSRDFSLYTEKGKSIFISATNSANQNSGNITIKSNPVSAGYTRGYLDIQTSKVLLNSIKIEGLADGSASTDAVNKGQLDSAFSSEEARALAAEAGLQSAIDQEISDRQSEVTRLEGLVSDEETRAMAAESLLSGRLDVLEAVVHEKESFTLSATDVSNGYIDLGAEAKDKSTMVHAGRLYGHEGVDYNLSVVNGVTRITFAGELASGGVSALVEGDKVYVKYMK